VRELLILVGLIGLLVSARSSLADHYRVPSGSMMPTVLVDDRIAVNKAAYGLRVPFTNRYFANFAPPTHGDVVVLQSPEEDKVLLKRIVAIPGDQVEVRSGALILNGARVSLERHQTGELEQLGDVAHPILRTREGGEDFGPSQVPSGQYLVLGDNRGDSRDGRFFGFVDGAAILGKAWGVYFRNGWFDWIGL